ncbi:glycoside hydrolase domain-containing protein [Psychromicrobium sp. YIM B11713]|uniref:glycoside hydrolase domain-containing protein n=1 Tax=Psychromicrobium sp. YIM B11713 TaxID=3145233 RepID=UPI00374F1A8D
MDPKVKEAQVWVNATYAGTSGYVPCPEDGLIGWSTMYSLVMGLQHELGISPVVAAFGPTTMSRLQTLGELNQGWGGKDDRIVRILQHGLFCKGYWGANTYGTFDGVTAAAVAGLRSNMGLPPGSSVPASIFRCILNLDAYIVLAGGTEKVRGIQQWLNGRYWQKDAYTIGPCDGIYSRDVQQSLMIALQYELGISSPNGAFGPATQAGLRTHSVQQGDSGIFVELFSAACVFNEPVPFDPEVFTTQRSTFDAKLGEFVSAFQAFSQLQVNGRGDYSTWAQLLVSTGDPDRPVAGCDTRFEITASRAQWLFNNGYRAIGRYLYNPPGSTLDKDIKPGELTTIFNAGLRVLPIFQDNARQLSDFTYTQGYQHALKAHERANAYGFARGTVIYFAVDYDATGEEIDSAVVPYFQGIQAGLSSQGKRYVHGVYGSRNVCAKVTKNTYARFSYISGMSWGFSGNLGFPLPSNWSFNQIKEFQVITGSDTFDLDRDVWRGEGGDPGQSSVNSTASPADEFISYIKKLYACAQEYGKGNPNQLVMEYLRSREYNDLRWIALIGSVDDGFVDFANKKGFSIMAEFQDPYTGYQIGVEHLMATANGHFLIPSPVDTNLMAEGDIAGWAGDLLTFYGDWRNESASYSSGYTYCMEKLGKPGIASSFDFDDLACDADGYLLAQRLRNGVDIVTAVQDYYGGTGGLKRFSDYYQQRFINAETCLALAHDALVTSIFEKIVIARTFLIGPHEPPITLPGNKLKEFEQGFADSLLSRVGMERKMSQTYQQNQRKLLISPRTK